MLPQSKHTSFEFALAAPRTCLLCTVTTDLEQQVQHRVDIVGFTAAAPASGARWTKGHGEVGHVVDAALRRPREDEHMPASPAAGGANAGRARVCENENMTM